MKVVVKPAFYRDISKLRSRELRQVLDEKITQIEKRYTCNLRKVG